MTNKAITNPNFVKGVVAGMVGILVLMWLVGGFVFQRQQPQAILPKDGGGRVSCSWTCTSSGGGGGGGGGGGQPGQPGQPIQPGPGLIRESGFYDSNQNLFGPGYNPADFGISDQQPRSFMDNLRSWLGGGAD